MRAVSGLGMRLCGVALAAILSGAFSAEAADVGGGYWPLLAKGKIKVARSTVGTVKFESNLRLDFDGAPGDLAGTGHVLVYDDAGQILKQQVPFNWTTGNGKSFQIEPSGPELGEFFVQRITDATGASCFLDLTDVTAKGTLKRAGEAASLSIRIAGDVSVEGGPMQRLRAALKGK